MKLFSCSVIGVFQLDSCSGLAVTLFYFPFYIALSVFCCPICRSPVACELILRMVPIVQVGGHAREAGGDVVELVDSDAAAEGVGPSGALSALLRWHFQKLPCIACEGWKREERRRDKWAAIFSAKGLEKATINQGQGSCRPAWLTQSAPLIIPYYSGSQTFNCHVPHYTLSPIKRPCIMVFS